MAEQIISPGVFTRENDLSFLPQGVGQIGAAIIGPTEAGPAFIPTVVRSFSEYEQRFGPLSSETYVPQTVREYLKNADGTPVIKLTSGTLSGVEINAIRSLFRRWVTNEQITTDDVNLNNDEYEMLMGLRMVGCWFIIHPLLYKK